MEMVRGIITYANSWSMVDENTGKERKGISIEYLMTEDLDPVENDDGSKGYKHCKESIPISCMDRIKQVPGVYDLCYELGIIKGKPFMKLNSISYVGQVEIDRIHKVKAV